VTDVTGSPSVTYAYDAADRRIATSVDGATFVTFGYEPDSGRLSHIQRGGLAFSFDYDNANRRTTLTYPNGVTTEYNYDRDSRLTGLVATGPSAAEVNAVGYRYDAAGNRTRKSTSALVEDYGYAAQHDGAPGAVQQQQRAAERGRKT
jgi:YD repeat-containing protein